MRYAVCNMQYHYPLPTRLAAAAAGLLPNIAGEGLATLVAGRLFPHPFRRAAARPLAALVGALLSRLIVSSRLLVPLGPAVRLRG